MSLTRWSGSIQPLSPHTALTYTRTYRHFPHCSLFVQPRGWMERWGRAEEGNRAYDSLNYECECDELTWLEWGLDGRRTGELSKRILIPLLRNFKRVLIFHFSLSLWWLSMCEFVCSSLSSRIIIWCFSCTGNQCGGLDDGTWICFGRRVHQIVVEWRANAAFPKCDV